MNNKLKLPLTAVFSFLLGGVVFFPWGDNNAPVDTKQLNASFIFDKIADRKTEFTVTDGDTKHEQLQPVTANIIVEYHFSEDEVQASNLAIKNQLKSYEVVRAKKLDQNNKKEVQTIVVEYHFSEGELKESNLAIRNQLKETDIVSIEKDAHNFDIKNEAVALKNDNSVAQTIVVEYRFSKEELQISNLAITNQLRQLNIANKGDTNEQVASLSERIETVENIKKPIKVKAVNYNFSADAIDISNSVIAKQLGRHLTTNEERKIKNEIHINISDLEVAEKSETDHFVNDVAEYTNASDSDAELEQVESNKIETYATSFFSTSEVEVSNDAISAQLRHYKEVEIAERPEINPSIKNDSNTSVVIDKLEIKKYTATNFSGAEFEISNLAISKQLNGYQSSVISLDDNTDSITNLDDNVTLEKISKSNKNLNTVEVNTTIKSEYEDESELLLSNSEHEDDDEDYSGVLVKYEIKPRATTHKKTSINEDDLQDDAAVESEEDDDEDEYSSERVVFSVEPLYFIDSFESDSIDNLDNNLDVPAVENINKNSKLELDNEEIEVIEEIEINDDGKITTSSFKQY